MNDKINNWKSQMSRCFGSVDKLFALHPSEEKNAQEMLKNALAENATIDEILSTAEEFLKSTNCSQEHTDSQIERMKNLESWL